MSGIHISWSLNLKKENKILKTDPQKLITFYEKDLPVLQLRVENGAYKVYYFSSKFYNFDVLEKFSDKMQKKKFVKLFKTATMSFLSNKT